MHPMPKGKAARRLSASARVHSRAVMSKLLDTYTANQQR